MDSVRVEIRPVEIRTCVSLSRVNGDIQISMRPPPIERSGLKYDITKQKQRNFVEGIGHNKISTN